MRLNLVIKDNQVVNKINAENGIYNANLTLQSDDKTYEQVKKLWATINDISMAEYGDISQSNNIYLQILLMAGMRVDSVMIPEIALNDLKKKVRALNIKSKEIINHIPVLFCDVCMTGISEMNKKEVAQVIECAIKYADEVGIDTDLERI